MWPRLADPGNLNPNPRAPDPNAPGISGSDGMKCIPRWRLTHVCGSRNVPAAFKRRVNKRNKPCLLIHTACSLFRCSVLFASSSRPGVVMSSVNWIMPCRTTVNRKFQSVGLVNHGNHEPRFQVLWISWYTSFLPNDEAINSMSWPFSRFIFSAWRIFRWFQVRKRSLSVST